MFIELRNTATNTLNILCLACCKLICILSSCFYYLFFILFGNFYSYFSFPVKFVIFMNVADIFSSRYARIRVCGFYVITFIFIFLLRLPVFFPFLSNSNCFLTYLLTSSNVLVVSFKIKLVNTCQ